MRRVHPTQCLVLVVAAVDGRVEYQPRGHYGNRRGGYHDCSGCQPPPALQHQKPAHGAGTEQGEYEQVYRGHHGIEFAAEDGGRDVELEQVVQ